MFRREGVLTAKFKRVIVLGPRRLRRLFDDPLYNLRQTTQEDGISNLHPWLAGMKDLKASIKTKGFPIEVSYLREVQHRSRLCEYALAGLEQLLRFYLPRTGTTISSSTSADP